MAPWKADLRWHETSELTDRTITDDVEAAVAAFRSLLSREDLIGKPVAARLVSPITKKSIYLSRFDKDLGEGRLHPDVPIEPFVGADQSFMATLWLPEYAIDWETDDRPLSQVLKSWHSGTGRTRDEAAADLRVPRSTYDGWCAGRSAALEGTIRRMLVLLDESYARKNGGFQRRVGVA